MGNLLRKGYNIVENHTVSCYKSVVMLREPMSDLFRDYNSTARKLDRFYTKRTLQYFESDSVPWETTT